MCKRFVFQTLLLPKVLTHGDTLTEGNQVIDVTEGLGELLQQPDLQQYFTRNFCALGKKKHEQPQLFSRLSHCRVVHED